MHREPNEQETSAIEEMKQNLEDGLKDKPTPTDYRLRTKKIWKGKIAPKGHFFVVVDFVKKQMVYRHAILLEGSYTQDEIKEVGEMLREQLKQKFGV
jgi:sRNA-binding regulator protein Hfq